jgi:hypothetical protein
MHEKMNTKKAERSLVETYAGNCKYKKKNWIVLPKTESVTGATKMQSVNGVE